MDHTFQGEKISCGMLQVGIDHVSLPRTHFLTAEAILCAGSILFFFFPTFYQFSNVLWKLPFSDFSLDHSFFWMSVMRESPVLSV